MDPLSKSNDFQEPFAKYPIFQARSGVEYYCRIQTLSWGFFKHLNEPCRSMFDSTICKWLVVDYGEGEVTFQLVAIESKL